MKKAVHSIYSKLKKYVANQPKKNNERKTRNSSNGITNKTTGHLLSSTMLACEQALLFEQAK